MSIIDDLKAETIAAAEKRWDEAIEGARRFFRYNNKHFSPQANAKVRELAHALLSSRDLYNVLGGMEHGFGIQMCGYPEYASGPPVTRLEFIRFFIGHEILDDGEPGVGYYRTTMGDEPRNNDMFVRCGPDDKGALPYFHCNIDLLRRDYPDAEWLSLEGALEILAAHKARHPTEICRGQRALWDLQGKSDDTRDRETDYILHGDAEDKQMLALADALAAEATPL